MVRRTTTLLPAAVRLTELLPSPASRAAPAVARIATVATVEERPDVSTVPTTMKHITYTPGCAAEGLTLTESPVPEVGDGEVLIRVAYAGVGGTDLAQRAGKFNPKPDAPAHHLIMGLEVSGVVARCGAGVSDFRPGDRVEVAEVVAEPPRLLGRIPLPRAVVGRASDLDARVDGATAVRLQVDKGTKIEPELP